MKGEAVIRMYPKLRIIRVNRRKSVVIEDPEGKRHTLREGDIITVECEGTWINE